MNHVCDEFNNLSVRTRNCLARANICTIDQLAAMRPKDLRSLPYFGVRCLRECEGVLAGVGRQLLPDSESRPVPKEPADPDGIVMDAIHNAHACIQCCNKAGINPQKVFDLVRQLFSRGETRD